MPKAQIDPVVKVQRYFEEADLASATTALAVAKEIVQRRKLQAAPAAPAPPKTRKPAGARTKKDADRPLPGMESLTDAAATGRG